MYQRALTMFMVGGWVRINPNVVRIVKSAQNNGRSLKSTQFQHFY